MMKKVKIFFVSNTSWYIYNFRLSLLQKLKKENYEVELIAPYDQYTKKIVEAGFKVHNLFLNRSSINPFNELITIFHLIYLYNKNNVKIVNHFTIKPCLYGSIAALFLKKLKVINTITGLGHLFIGKKSTNFLLRVLKPIIKLAFNNKSIYLIFQNINDFEEYQNIGFASRQNSVLIKGSGVDTNFFSRESNQPRTIRDIPYLLFPSRIIKEKGIFELINACKNLLKKNIPVKLILAGNLDKGNRSSLSEKELEVLKNSKNITFTGHIDNIKERYFDCDIVVLPSWREGLSRSLVEASSMECPIITTNISGCKDVITNEVNGYLVEIKNSKLIEKSIIKILNNKERAIELGKNARQIAQKNFDIEIINRRTIDLYLLINSNKKVDFFEY